MNNFFGLQPINQYLFLHPEEELRVREWEASLKRHALIFDKIGIYGYREEGEPDSINWLIEQDVLFRVAFEPSKEFVIAAYPEIEVYLPELFKWYSEEQKEETSYQNRAAK